jgi:hypothetical protein
MPIHTLYNPNTKKKKETKKPLRNLVVEGRWSVVKEPGALAERGFEVLGLWLWLWHGGMGM